MGGGTSGELAARVGAGAICDRVRTGCANKEPPELLLEATLRAGQTAVRRLHTDPNHRGCGSTVVAAWLQGGRAYITWLGDSPAFRVSAGRLERLTWAHDTRGFLIRAGTFTEAEAHHHRIRNALHHYLGSRPEEWPLEIPSFVPLTGDRLILATNGVSDFLDDGAILATCQTISDPTTCAEALVEHALMAGSRDNCTCAVIAFD
jgi:protein phosphatase